MDYKEFKEQLKADVVKLLSDNGIETTASYHSVTKANESYEAMTVTPVDSHIGVNFNIERMFDAMKTGKSYEEVLDRTVATIEKGIEDTPELNVSSLTDYEQMKDKLVMEVISKEKNEDLLETIPHKDIEDMAVVYRFVLTSNPEGRSSILVTNNILDAMGVTPDRVHEDAMINSPELKPAIIRGMTEVITEMMGISKEELAAMGMGTNVNEKEMMYVASVPDQINGAGVIAYQDFMDQAAEKLGGDFFVLPSSRHEILLVPDDGLKSLRELKEMVAEVNATQVQPEDKLTDSVYHYDSKHKVFELGEKFVERQNEKESVLGKLKEKKENIAKQPKKDVVERTAKSKGGEAR